MATPTTLPASFTAGQVLTAAQQNALRGAFRILQVVSVFKADTFSMTGTTYTDVTGLSVSITPQSSSSQILCMGQISTSATAGEQVFGQLLRGATAIGNSTGGSSINSITTSGVGQSNLAISTNPIFFVDSPATTSATTYKIQIRTGGAAAVGYINRRQNDTALGASSSLILMEVSA
jgi:hypothetical protein